MDPKGQPPWQRRHPWGVSRAQGHLEHPVSPEAITAMSGVWEGAAAVLLSLQKTKLFSFLNLLEFLTKRRTNWNFTIRVSILTGQSKNNHVIKFIQGFLKADIDAI